jgi:hypothetical protein
MSDIVERLQKWTGDGGAEQWVMEDAIAEINDLRAQVASFTARERLSDIRDEGAIKETTRLRDKIDALKADISDLLPMADADAFTISNLQAEVAILKAERDGALAKYGKSELDAIKADMNLKVAERDVRMIKALLREVVEYYGAEELDTDTVVAINRVLAVEP